MNSAGMSSSQAGGRGGGGQAGGRGLHVRDDAGVVEAGGGARSQGRRLWEGWEPAMSRVVIAWELGKQSPGPHAWPFHTGWLWWHLESVLSRVLPLVSPIAAHPIPFQRFFLPKSQPLDA